MIDYATENPMVVDGYWQDSLPKSPPICSICFDEIYDGEKRFINDYGEHFHATCYRNMIDGLEDEELAEMLGMECARE